MQQTRLGRLQLAAVAPSAFRIEEQILLLQNFGHVRLQRDQVDRILAVPANRNRADDMPLDQAERATEEIDPGGDERRTNAVIVQHERLDQVIRVAAMVRRVDDAVVAGGGDDVVQVFVLALDLAEDRIQGMLQRPVEAVPLGGLQLVEVPEDPLARILPAALSRGAPQVLDDFFTRQDRLGDVIQHGKFGLYHAHRSARPPAARV